MQRLAVLLSMKRITASSFLADHWKIVQEEMAVCGRCTNCIPTATVG